MYILAHAEHEVSALCLQLRRCQVASSTQPCSSSSRQYSSRPHTHHRTAAHSSDHLPHMYVHTSSCRARGLSLLLAVAEMPGGFKYPTMQQQQQAVRKPTPNAPPHSSALQRSSPAYVCTY